MADTNTTEEQVEGGYDIDWIPVTDLVWGRGFIAPGGEANVARIVEGVDLSDKRVLELGSGAGGGTIALARNHSAIVVGLEIEEPLVELSRQLAAEMGYAGQVEFRCVKPGPLPVEDNSFDYFYTSGVVCHIENKQSLFEDVFRVLKPGGWLLGYDWFAVQPNAAIDAWMQAANLHIYNSSLQAYADNMNAAGFETINTQDATDWYVKQAANELERLQGPLYDQAAAITSPEIRDSFILEWGCLNTALATGDFRQGYFRGRKPD
jgi:phosphoethanolamine N-methyltransferase